MLASQGIGLVATVIVLAGAGEPAPGIAALAWAALAGLSGVGGLACYYLALSRGTMGLIAPLAAVIGAGVPAVVSIALGEQIAELRLIGIVAAIIAVALISLPTGRPSRSEAAARRIDRAEVPFVVLSGLGFAGFYLFLDASAGAGGDTWWPLLLVRLLGLACVVGGLVVLVVLLRRSATETLGWSRLRAAGSRRVMFVILPLLVLAGAGDLGGNAFFLLANQVDALPVAVVLSSLYPVVTTLLAAAFLHERLRIVQWTGVGLAVLGVALIGVGGAPA